MKAMYSFYTCDFQVKCEDAWESYDACTNETLLEAYLTGYQTVTLLLHGSWCKFDFELCTEHDLATGRLRYFAFPVCGAGAGSPPVVSSGSVVAVEVSEEFLGRSLRLPHPAKPVEWFHVEVPKKTVPGTTLFVPEPVRLYERVSEGMQRLSDTLASAFPSLARFLIKGRSAYHLLGCASMGPLVGGHGVFFFIQLLAMLSCGKTWSKLHHQRCLWPTREPHVKCSQLAQGRSWSPLRVALWSTGNDALCAGLLVLTL